MDELEAAMAMPFEPIVTGPESLAGTAANECRGVEVTEANGFVKVLEVPISSYFAHDLARDRCEDVVGRRAEGEWPRNFLVEYDTVACRCWPRRCSGCRRCCGRR